MTRDPREIADDLEDAADAPIHHSGAAALRALADEIEELRRAVAMSEVVPAVEVLRAENLRLRAEVGMQEFQMRWARSEIRRLRALAGLFPGARDGQA